MNIIKKKLSIWQKVFLLFAGVLLISSTIFLAQSYFSYQQVKSASDQCYDQGGFPKVVKSGFELKVFECNFHDKTDE
ncbi:hypothetical protein [Planococcus halotolerans]|uniref:hypothetical protein n=1 Tax=Planococcus halotolerans TaxID=2233542 RepID=UPI001057CE21|nr:hypothetical protein [Planococcus halotolerans]